MLTYSLRLHFVPLGEPGGPVAHIALRAYGKDEDGNIFISSDCLCLTELEWEVKRLKEELNTIIRAARRRRWKRAP